MTKFESLFYKINTFLEKTTTCTGLQAEQILSVNIYIHIFSILGVAFAVPFLCYFQKKIELISAALYFYLCELKMYVSIFKILFQTGDINILVLRGVFFSRYVQLKSTFSDENKHQR